MSRRPSAVTGVACWLVLGFMATDVAASFWYLALDLSGIRSREGLDQMVRLLMATEGTRKQRRVLYVVLQGELHYVKRIRAERAAVMMVLRPGDVGGFLTFLNEEPSPVSVRSAGKTTVLEIGRRELQNLGVEQAPLAVKLQRVLVGDIAKRMASLLERVASTSAWALDLDRHLRMLPLLPGASESD